MIVEGTHPRMGWLIHDNRADTAAHHLVAQMYTDAIMHQDIRCIQTIINRTDGGLPKDSEIAMYRTEFADSVRRVLAMTSQEQLKVDPEDTVMDALAKSLYEIAAEDIYWDQFEGKAKKPSDTKKQLRDNAMRMILERAGGRKQKVEIPEVVEEYELSPWVQEAYNN